ncbi:guided entry of tail-anchored proteins factor 1 [Procambarus clarkii]|uniref:guided entry of tail-anchored proteins factor 1 n=1 Tax=Procambarus clarkii TaxID=6728 RepID=UPI001E678E61|nr:guided entry of tail-anchored proteins factor 1-like [Procambarus clarkii]
MILFVMTTALGCAGVVLPSLVHYVLRAIGGEGAAERQIRHEVGKLKQQLQNISMVDQFATYARVQRKINSLNQLYKGKVMERSMGEQRVRLVLGGMLRAVVGFLCVWLVWEHQGDPVFSLSPDLVWPLGALLSFPGCQLGQISVMMWLGVVRTACSRMASSMTASTVRTGPQLVPPVFAQSATPVAPPLD